jgi:hypothetical protein
MTVASVMRNIFSPKNQSQTNLIYCDEGKGGVILTSETETSTSALDDTKTSKNGDTDTPKGDNFTITQDANRMIAQLIEEEVKRIVGLVKGRAEIYTSTTKRKKKDTETSTETSPVPTPDDSTSKKKKKPKRRRINLTDVQDIASHWNPNVEVYSSSILSTSALLKSQETLPPTSPSGIKRLQDRVSSGKTKEGDEERMKEARLEQELLLGESRVKMGTSEGYIVG